MTTFISDMMDGRFVPNFALDFTLLQAVTEMSRTPLVCHLMMIEEPERYLERTAGFAPAFISIHFESTRNLQRALQQIRRAGAEARYCAQSGDTDFGAFLYPRRHRSVITVMTVNPSVSAGQTLVPATLKKISDIRRILDTEGYSHIELEVDGNVSFDHIPAMIARGATMLVGGTSSVFAPHHTIATAVAKFETSLKVASLDKPAKHRARLVRA